jgi:hypothetical protein
MNFWIHDISILFQNYKDFYPKKNMSNIEKANSIMRFAIYYSLLLILFNLNSSWLTISFLLVSISIFIGITENFNNDTNSCVKPTKNNPYMNFTLDDHINNPQRNRACELNQNILDEELKYFRQNINGDSILNKYNLYSKNNNDRNFYTMPSTTIVNDQEGFAKFVFGDRGRCKSDGIDCLKHSDNRFFKGRYSYQY